MAICTLCPRNCRVERDEENGYCGVGNTYRIARIARHLWEEPVISGKNGSGTVFFSGCNLRCVFCQNHELSHTAYGTDLTEEKLICELLRLQEEGAHNINLVTPTHYTALLVKTLEKAKNRLQIPVVWNSGGYEKAETLRLLTGLVDVYLPDFKYCSAELSMAYSNAKDYCDVALRAVAEMLRQQPEWVEKDGVLQKGVLVRHLVLPGCRKDSIDILHLLKEQFGTDGYRISLMRQYTPEFASDCPYRNLQRRVTSFEYESVVEEANRLGFCGFMQEKSSASSSFTPDFHEKTF